MPYRPNPEFKDVNDLQPKTVLNSLSANIALKVLLTQRETDKLDLEKIFLLNIKQMVLSYLDELK